MPLDDFSEFQHITHLHGAHLLNELENNLKSYCDWAFLRIGGWQDINIPTSGAFGGAFSQLRPVDDPSYTDGQVWEGVRKDWVWETGVNYVDPTGGGPHNPVAVSVTLNGTGTPSHHVNYPLGRIVFDNPMDVITDTVEASYAYRAVQVYRADDAPWWRELQYRSQRPDDSHVNQFGSGNWSILSQHRVQLPALIIEVVPRGRSRGTELGNNSITVSQDVLFHIIAETRYDRNNITDAIRYQCAGKTIWLYNSDELGTAYPLDYRGELTGTMRYPDFVQPDPDGYRWRRCIFEDAVITDVESIHPNLYEAVVRTTTQVIMGGK